MAQLSDALFGLSKKLETVNTFLEGKDYDQAYVLATSCARQSSQVYFSTINSFFKPDVTLIQCLRISFQNLAKICYARRLEGVVYKICKCIRKQRYDEALALLHKANWMIQEYSL